MIFILRELQLSERKHTERNDEIKCSMDECNVFEE